MMLGGRNGGFFAGAIGGVLLALLLVGAATFLPQHNGQVGTTPLQESGVGASVTETTTSTYSSAGTSTTTVAGGAVTTTTAIPGHVVTTTTTATTTVTGTSTINAPGSTTATSSTTSQTSGAFEAATTTATTTTVTATLSATNSATTTQRANDSWNSFQTSAVFGGSGGTEHGPGSLLTNLPGQTVGGLLATLSPLLVGLLVGALVYTAYLRRQDSG